MKYTATTTNPLVHGEYVHNGPSLSWKSLNVKVSTQLTMTISISTRHIVHRGAGVSSRWCRSFDLDNLFHIFFIIDSNNG